MTAQFEDLRTALVAALSPPQGKPEPRNRGRRNSNERGSAANRRARRQWLVSPAAGFGGDGVQVPCQAPTPEAVCRCGRAWPCRYRQVKVRGTGQWRPSKWHSVKVCGELVTAATMVVGRIVPGHQGGKYRRDNVRPECPGCSCREGQQVSTAIRMGGKA